MTAESAAKIASPNLRSDHNMSKPIQTFGQLPETGYIRQSLLIPLIVPVSSATLWRKVKAGQFPRPVKLSERVTAWRVEDIREWMKSRTISAKGLL